MAQRWLGLTQTAMTQITDRSKYYMGNTTNSIVLHSNMHENFITYMPDSKTFISATTAINFHDCYKVGDTGYAHASFAFIAPGYYAGFPIAFGFAGVNKAGSVWVIGQKQVYVQSDTTNTKWEAAFETSFGWPTEPAGVLPFISVGGVPFWKRYKGTAASTAVKYYENYAGGNIKTFNYSLQSTNIANIESGDTIASNAFNQTYDGWTTTDTGFSISGKGAKALCPVVYPNWVENANSSFIGGWKNRGDSNNSYPVGVGTVFATSTTATYGSAPKFDNAAFSCAVKVWVYDSAGKPQKAKQVYVYNSSGAPVRAKHLYVYNSSGVPVQVF